MFKKIIIKISKELQRKNIPYMIIGGQAVLVYGEPRLTRDIDIALGLSIEQKNVILKIIKNIKLKPLVDDIDGFVKETMVLPVADEKSGIRVDFIFSFTPYERQAIERSLIFMFDKQEVRFATPEDVIIHKGTSKNHV